jgi:hypothetical protein
MSPGRKKAMMTPPVREHPRFRHDARSYLEDRADGAARAEHIAAFVPVLAAAGLEQLALALGFAAGEETLWHADSLARATLS